MSITRNSFKRPAALFAAAAILVGAAVPAFLAVRSADAAQLLDRSIQMSDSRPSATAVEYKVTFTPSASFQSFIIDFCGNTPLIGDTCDVPTGFSAASVPTSNGAWTITASATQLKFTASSAQGTAATPYTLTLTNLVNPDLAGSTVPTQKSFYARIYTYNDAAWGGYVSATSVGTKTDDGGIALSVNSPIQVTARVMETMALCTSGGLLPAQVADNTNGFSGVACAGATTPAIIVGHGTNNVLDATQVDTRSAFSQITTNANNGYAIYMRATNKCGGGLSKSDATDLTTTACGIPAVAAGNATGAALVAGTAAFGVQISNGTPNGTGTGDNQAIARWATSHIMDETSANDNVKWSSSTYGSKVIDTSAATVKQANGVENKYTFAATASPTTPAGVYTNSFVLIGVGVF